MLDQEQSTITNHDKNRNNPLIPTRRRWPHITIGILAVLLLALGTANFLTSNAATFIAGTGTVRGIILDENGAPVEAEIFIENSNLDTKTGKQGEFELRGLPSGRNILVITWMYAGYEIPVEIHRGGITDLGSILVPTNNRLHHDPPRLEWR